jgi:caffeoyl-CoA O-methyltransferase
MGIRKESMGMKYIFQIGLIIIFSVTLKAQQPEITTDIDQKVKNFLESHKNEWHDLNIPASDGKVLYDLIIKNNYTRALEIGTSTGHSAIWIAWALSKTGGKLITIEINRFRHKEALENFKEAGLDSYIDAHLGDAHELVPALKDSFDFVFVDADKDWYCRYLGMLKSQMVVGSCFTAHNVLNTYMSGIRDFLNCLSDLQNFKTEIIHSSSSGISVSYKMSGQ